MIPPARSALAKNQAARANVVFRVLLNHFGTLCNRPFNVAQFDTSENQPPQQVIGNEVGTGASRLSDFV